mgnify:CR=1 FL=1
MDRETIEILNDKLRTNLPTALVTVIGSSGPTPATAGAMMVVHKNERVAGTVGGGDLEFQALAAVYAPMGLNIASTEPKEIALSIMSEMLLVKNSGSADHLKNVKKVDIPNESR